MTTAEVVARIAATFGGWPHTVWAWPLHYFLEVRREWIKIAGLAPDDTSDEDTSTRRKVGPDITVETIPRAG